MRAIPFLLLPAAALCTLLLAGPGLAHEREHGERGEHESHESRQREGRDRGEGRSRSGGAAPLLTSPAAALYVKECGSCHLAYPPGMLPAASWRRTMEGLERHFGQNAELDPQAQAELTTYLVDSAAESGSDRKSRKILSSLGGGAPLRVSETPYFQRKHREVAAGVIARPTIKTWANCGACHGGAREWDFSEDRVKIPR
ncbi:MAG: diheme cytochrome c [Deltaproteobacteria bacterium]|nr:diheme cytochrome c [Deltaproteobacteria bacterium]